MPTVRQLEYLVALADLKHFRRAADKANTTQPTLSGQLKALEERLGVELVERSRSRVVLTPAGVEVVEVARRVLRDVREIRGISAAHNKRLSGVVRLGLPSSIGPSLVPKIVPDLRREYPDLKFYVREELPQRLAESLGDGTFDIIIGPALPSGENIEVVELYSEPLHLVVPVTDTAARKGGLSGAQLSGAPVLTLADGHPLSDMVRDYCRKIGVTVSRDFEGTSLDTLREMVSTGLGVTFLPALYIRAQQLSKDKTLRIVELDGCPLSRSIGMAWRRSSARPTRYADLSRFLRGTVERVIGPL